VQELWSDHFSGGRRNRRHHFGHWRVLRWVFSHYHHFRPGHGFEDRGSRPGGHDGNPAGHLRHPTRRSLDGPAYQDRAGGPASGSFRPQLGGTHPGARSGHSRRLPLDGPGSLPHRPQIYGSGDRPFRRLPRQRRDRKSTRLNSSHRTISYAVFCLKKKKKKNKQTIKKTAFSASSGADETVSKVSSSFHDLSRQSSWATPV